MGIDEDGRRPESSISNGHLQRQQAGGTGEWLKGTALAPPEVSPGAVVTTYWSTALPCLPSTRNSPALAKSSKR